MKQIHFATAVAALIISPAWADPVNRVQTQNLNNAPRLPSTRPAEADKEYATQKLLQPVEIPNLPAYSGRAKFIEGLRYPNDTSGQRLGMTYAVPEDADQVLDWYRTALKNYSWNVLNFSPGAKSITAVKDGNTFTLQINEGAKQPGYRTVMVLSYKSKK
jgi:hypothetical protein